MTRMEVKLSEGGGVMSATDLPFTLPPFPPPLFSHSLPFPPYPRMPPEAMITGRNEICASGLGYHLVFKMFQIICMFLSL